MQEQQSVATQHQRQTGQYCFAIHAGVKDAVVNAVEELYLKDTTGNFMDPRKAAENLVALAQGSSLGEPFSAFANLPSHV